MTFGENLRCYFAENIIHMSHEKLIELLPDHPRKIETITAAALKSSHLAFPIDWHAVFWYATTATPLDFQPRANLQQPVLVAVRTGGGIGDTFVFDEGKQALVNPLDPSEVDNLYKDFQNRPFIEVLRNLAKFDFLWENITRVVWDCHHGTINFANGDTLFFGGGRQTTGWHPLSAFDGSDLARLKKFLTLK